MVVPVSEEELEKKEAALRIGAPVRFTFRGSAAHVFDKETGVNLERLPPPVPAPAAPPTDQTAQEETAAAQAAPDKSVLQGDPFAEDAEFVEIK